MHTTPASRLSSGAPEYVLFSDFDGTITVGDTCNTIVQEALQTLHLQDTDQASVRRQHWETISRQYMEEYSGLMRSRMTVLVSEDSFYDLTTKAVGQLTLDLQILRASKFLEFVHPVELRGISLTQHHLILAGLSRDQLFTLGQTISVRPRSIQALSSFLASPRFHVFIVSANWTFDLIRGCLSPLSCTHLPSLNPPSPTFLPRSSVIPVCCSELEYHPENGLSTGLMHTVIVTPHDKLSFLRHAMHHIQTTTSSRPYSVFVGDTIYDLLAMMEADVGIIIGNPTANPSSSLFALCRAFHLALAPLSSFSPDSLSNRAPRHHHHDHNLPLKTLYFTEDWNEIASALG